MTRASSSKDSTKTRTIGGDTLKTKVRRSRTQLVAFYVSDEEKAAIVKLAQNRDMSISDYCRKVLIANSENREEE